MSVKRLPYLEKAIDEGSKELGDALRTARKRRGMTLAHMAEKVGVTRRTLIRLEKGDSKVNLGTVLACLAVYGLMDQFVAAVAPNKDHQGAEKERLRLPKRVRRKKQMTGDTDVDMSKL